MTIRAVILGLLGATFIAAVGYFNNRVVHLTLLVGKHLLISVFGALIVVGLAVNPLLHALKPAWRLGSGELAVSLALVLFACAVPGSSLMRVFPTSPAMPMHYYQTSPGWRKNQVLHYVPPVMMPRRAAKRRGR